jgi:N-acyl-D-aspartate/D-glutamate deacylase
VLISLFAPTLVTDTAGGDHVKVPAAGIVAVVLAFGATIVLAIVGFRGGTQPAAERPREEPRPAAHDAPSGA